MGVRLIGTLLLLSLLTGCTFSVDPAQLRVCSLLPGALEPEGSAITVTEAFPAAAPYAVEIRYAARPPTEPILHQGVVRCGFGEVPGGTLGLSVAAWNGQKLSDIQLQLIRRWWLPTAEPPASQIKQALVSAEPPTSVGYFLQMLVNAGPLAAIDALLALAYALVYGLIGRILFGFGEIAVIGGFGTVIALVLAAPMPPLLALFALCLPAAIVLSSLAGRAMAAILASPLHGRSGFALLVASIGLAIAVPEGLRLSQGPDDLWISPVLAQPVTLVDASGFAVSATLMQAIVASLALLAVIATLLAMRGTAAGRAWRAVSEDAHAAALLGIPRYRVLAGTFVVSGALAGVAGFILVAHYGGIGFSSGLLLGLKALLAAVVGGIGSPLGAVLAGALTGLAETLWSGYLDIAYKDVAILAMLVLLLVARPGGLMGFADRTPRPV